MANAIKTISVQRGHDVTEYVLNCFGGAGGQHACLVADTLGIKTVLIHPYSGVLSAYGMGLADIRATRNRAVMKPLDPATALEPIEAELEAEAAGELRGQGVAASTITIVARAHIRYDGTDTALPVTVLEKPYAGGSAGIFLAVPDIARAFETAHRSQYGFAFEDKPLIVESFEVEAIGGGADIDETTSPRFAGTGRTVAADALLFARRLARCRRVPARRSRPRQHGRRPCPGHRAAPDHRRRGRTGRRRSPPATISS